MNNSNNILGLYKFNVETFESNTDNKNQPLLFVEFDENRNQFLLRNSNLTFNPSTNTLNSTNINVTTNTDINGGTIDGCNITVGSGKTLNVSAGTLTLADNQISGDKVEGGTINAITINTLTASSILSNGTTFSLKEKNDSAVMTISTENTGDTTSNSSIELDQTNSKIKLTGGSLKLTVNESSRYELENSNNVRLSFYNNNSGTDEKYFEIQNNDGDFTIKNFNDSRTNSFNPLVIERKSTSNLTSNISFSCETQFLIRDTSSNNKFVLDIATSNLTCTTVTANVNGNITVGSGETLNVSAGTLTLADNQISGDKVEGGTINAITINTLTASSILSNDTTFSLKEKNDSAVMTISTENTGDTTSNSSIELDQTNSKITLLGLNKKFTINATNRFEFENPSNVVLSLYTTTGNTDQKYIEVQNSGGSFNVAFLNDARDSTFTPMILTRKLNSNLCASAFFSLETQFVLRDTSLTEKFVFDIANSSLKSGNLDIGTWNQNTSFSQFRNSSVTGVGDYALLQSNTGATFLNSAAGQVLNLGINNSYKLIVGTDGDITIPSNNLILSVGQIKFTHFQIAGSSSSFMGVLGFNRNVSDGTIFNSTYNAFQIHNHNGKLHFQTYSNLGAEIDANTMVLTSGEVAIAQSTATEKLDVNGAVKATAFDNSSDDRVKKNEKNITNALSVINKLSCESYDKVKQIVFKKEQPTNSGLDNFSKTTDEIDWDLNNYPESDFMKEAGFIAQEVFEIDELKDYVKQGDEKKLWTINYNSIFTYAIASIQELSQENTELKNKINNLEADIALIKQNLNL
jgi:hypothetical protein